MSAELAFKVSDLLCRTIEEVAVANMVLREAVLSRESEKADAAYLSKLVDVQDRLVEAVGFMQRAAMLVREEQKR